MLLHSGRRGIQDDYLFVNVVHSSTKAETKKSANELYHYHTTHTVVADWGLGFLITTRTKIEPFGIAPTPPILSATLAVI